MGRCSRTAAIAIAINAASESTLSTPSGWVQLPMSSVEPGNPKVRRATNAAIAAMLSAGAAPHIGRVGRIVRSMASCTHAAASASSSAPMENWSDSEPGPVEQVHDTYCREPRRARKCEGAPGDRPRNNRVHARLLSIVAFFSFSPTSSGTETASRSAHAGVTGGR